MTIIVNTGSTLTVTNANGLTITGDSTVAAGGLLDGAGTITGAFTLLNLGTIAADVLGSVLRVGVGTLTNQGTVTANNGVLIVPASVVTTNFTGSTLTGGTWGASGSGLFEMLGGQIVTDNAAITLNGTGAAFDGFNAGTLQPIENSLTMIGSSGVLSLLGGRDFQLANALTVAGTVALGGGILSATSNSVTIDAGALLKGFGTLDLGTPFQADGTIEAANGKLTLPGASLVNGTGTLVTDPGASMELQAFGSYTQNIVNNGTINAAFIGFTGSLSLTGTYSGTGGFLIEGGGAGLGRTILELPGVVSANVAFDVNAGELLLDQAATFNGTISGFGNNDTLVLGSVAKATQATLDGNTLNLANSGGTIVQSVTLDIASMDYGNASFHVTENQAGTQATVTVAGVQAAACFAAGTRIRTPDGDVAVEQLAAGDIVQTRFAGAAPVIWLGHRHVNCRRHPDPAKVWPVCISAHAFGPRQPARDLLLSPDHAVFVDDVLIPVKHLINGKTIAYQQVDEVTYYHVELGEHDVLLAEGLPAESYLENGDRAAFDNAGELVSMHPEFGARRWDAMGCAPMIVAGETLAGVVRRLGERIPKPRQSGWRAG